MVDLKPTDAELALLQILWELGPSTVRQVHDQVRRDRDLAYTSVLKLLQIMHDKGLVLRDTSQRSHVYTPVHSARRVRGVLVRDLLDKAFAGSAAQLVSSALSDTPDPDELAAIRALLDELES